jgi:hypothetical protein
MFCFLFIDFDCTSGASPPGWVDPAAKDGGYDFVLFLIYFYFYIYIFFRFCVV